ncbi:MAG: RNA 2'-phosphotransferase [Chitinophagaceae bacterium]
MNEKHKKTVSKFLSLVLRHQPETIGLQLDANGWAVVAELIEKSANHDQPFSKEELDEIVTTNDKQRFIFNDDHTKIRANQGHSIDVELNLPAVEPPELLYHGTVARFIGNIKVDGLQKMQRQHVHLSKDTETAIIVGDRRGKALILSINSGHMHADGFKFYLSANGVWLTDIVPATYINFPIQKES